MASVQNAVQLGERIRQVRLLKGKSQGELAHAIGVDRTAIPRIEKGDRKVSAVDLIAIAACLGVTFSDLVTMPEPDALAARRPLDEEIDESERARGRAELELDAAWRDLQQLREYSLLSPTPLQFGGHGLDSLDAASSLAHEARRFLGLTTEPLGDIADVAARFGLWCRTTSEPVVGLSMTPEPGFGVCLIGAHLDPGRRRATVAHEVGHHLAGDTYQGPTHYVSQSEAEELVDAFLGEFLLPTEILREELRPSREHLIHLAGTYRVSWSLLIRAARSAGADVEYARPALTPERSEFLAVLGAAPVEDLCPPGLPKEWVKACALAKQRNLVTDKRADEMAMGALL